MHRLVNYLTAILMLATVCGFAFLSPALGFSGKVSAEPADNEYGSRRNVFVHTINEGDVIEDAVEIRNQSGETLTAFVFSGGWEVIDGELVEAQLADDRIDEPGTWLEFEKNEFVLSPGQTKIVKFKINVPDKIDVGDHQTILYVQGVESKSQVRGSGLNITIRNGITIYMTVPGEIDRTLLVEKISHRISPFWKLFTKQLFFNVKFANEGNVTLRPVADIEMRGLFGSAGSMEDIEYTKVRREETTEAEKQWIKRAPYFGRFVVDFDFHLGEKEQVNEDGTTTLLPDEIVSARYVFWVFPWIEIIYLIIILFVVHLIRSGWIYILITRRLRVKTKTHTVKKGETLTTIARKYGITTKLLVHFNLMRWPYEISSGDKLLIPCGRVTGEEWRQKVGTSLRQRNVWKSLVGHWFVRQHPYRVAEQVEPAPLVKPRNVATVVVDKGDTIQHVADFAGVSTEKIIALNNLRPPYRLRAGQELLIPKKKSTRAKPKEQSKKSLRRAAAREPRSASGKTKRRKR